MKFPEYRSLKGHFLRDLGYTVLFCPFIALFLRIIGVADTMTIGLVQSYSIGLSICTIIYSLFSIIRPQKMASLLVSLSLGIILGAFVGWHAGIFILSYFLSIHFAHTGDGLGRRVTLCLAFGAVVSYFIMSRHWMAGAKAEMQEERIKRLSSEKEALEARLRLLQAQVEPHFLFNTLSTIHSLMDRDTDAAGSMLVDLITYLRTSLHQSRMDRTTLGKEMEIAQAYLNIFKIRMGERLRYAVDVPQDLKAMPFPPMLVQPLVENAVRHGLEPRKGGGEIMIRAGVQDNTVRVEVADTGSGFSGMKEEGVGLSNVSERLRLLYGDGARLVLEENRPHGVRAIIEVPYDSPDQGRHRG